MTKKNTREFYSFLEMKILYVAYQITLFWAIPKPKDSKVSVVGKSPNSTTVKLM